MTILIKALIAFAAMTVSIGLIALMITFGIQTVYGTIGITSIGFGILLAVTPAKDTK